MAVGVNKDQFFTGKVKRLISPNESAPRIIVCSDRYSQLIVLSIYGIASDALKKGDVVAIADPVVKEIQIQKINNISSNQLVREFGGTAIPKPSPMNNRSSTLKPTEASPNPAGADKYGTYRKPLPTLPSDGSLPITPDVSRLSLRSPTSPHQQPQLPPKSGSMLNLPNRPSLPLPPTSPANNSNSNSSTSPSTSPTPTPPVVAAAAEPSETASSAPPRATVNLSASKGDMTFSRSDATITIIPNEAVESFTHPNLDHLASFTAMRDLKAKEILTTERTYCDNMRVLVENFIEPLKLGEGGISRENAIIICSNLADILLISIEMLNRLEEKLANWSATQRIGDVFLTLIPFLKMYTNYTVGYDSVMTVVGECEKNSAFVSFIQKCTENPRTRKLDLRSYLIQPVQRITRYHMLLDELLKHTEPTHPDYADLAKSLAEMKKVTSEANEAIKEYENRMKVMEIHKMFVGDADIVAAHRSFVYEGVLMKVCRKACKKRHVFLFSDMLVYGSSIPPKLLLHEKIMLDHCRIEDIPDGDTGGSRSISLNGQLINNAFQICSNKKSFVVFADSPDAKMQWMIKLIETIGALKEKKSTLKSDKITRSEAPVWVPDETTTNCPYCTEPFTLLNRRHHCRNCGSLVCGKCSDKKYKLPVSDYKPARSVLIFVEEFETEIDIVIVAYFGASVQESRYQS
eukprot:gene12286-14403_t